MFKIKNLAIICVFTLPFVSGYAQAKDKNGSLDLSRLVVVGDSLSAGVQNFALLDAQQQHGYSAVIASQAGVPLTLPLIAPPGAPNALELISLGPPPVIGQKPCPPPNPAPDHPCAPRDDPFAIATNIAVPGITVHQALTLRPSLTTQDPIQGWATLVLGFPYLILPEPQAPTEIELAGSLHPTTVIEALGNNDALLPAVTGQISTLTPIVQFAVDYEAVLDRLSKTGATIITANIPDVTEVAFFVSAQTIAAQAGLPVSTVTEELGIGPGDYVRITATALVDAILSGQKPGPLPAVCPSPLSALGANVPCVLTASDAAKVRTAIALYNGVIALESVLHGAVMVDVHSLVDRIHANGYTINGQKLTTDFLGGLFSLDGIHPTNTGYAIIANEFIDTMNRTLKAGIPEADVASIAATDPLVFPGKP